MGLFPIEDRPLQPTRQMPSCCVEDWGAVQRQVTQTHNYHIILSIVLDVHAAPELHNIQDHDCIGLRLLVICMLSMVVCIC